MKKLTIAVLAFATLGIAAVPALAQNNDDATIIENTSESVITGNGNRTSHTSVQQNQERNRNGGNRGTVMRNSSLCDVQGDDNSCEHNSVQQNQTRRSNRRGN
jgi:hypothetical protein